jgi:hypothetical protein
MSARGSTTRTVLTRSLLTVGVAAGLGTAFVAGTSYGGSGAAPQPWHRTTVQEPPATDASPAAYAGSGLSLQGSCADLLQWYVDRGLDLVGPYGWAGYATPYYFEDAVPSPLAASSGVAGSAEQAAPAPAPVRSTNEETGTNVQEAGVDEPDVVKTDGRTLYRVQGAHLVVYDVTGTEVQRLTSLVLPGGRGADSTELLLSGDTLVALSQHQPAAGEPGTELATLDVSDPAEPEVTHTVEYDGALVAARLHDGVVRVAVQAGLPELDFTLPTKHTSEAAALRANREAVRASTIDDWLPHASLDGGDPQPAVACDRVAVPDDATSLGTLAVVGFDASAPDAPSTAGLAVDTDLVYASTDQLYLATGPSYRVFGGGCLDCRTLQAPGSGLTDLLPGWITGSRSGAPAPRPTYADDGTSHLYAFDLHGIDTTFAASGEVDGEIRDRWSMDAVDTAAGPVLRVAVGPTARTGNFNSIVTLRQEGNELVEAGRLDDLGVGEEIESVRWFDTLAIVVTYRQVDPLYAVDLTDVDHPRLLGSLKIPGYSAYLHPLGQHRLLGLGQLEDGGYWGAQAGLFNVTDLTHPRQLDVVKFGAGSTALAGTDPRQLTWLPDGRTVLTVVSDYGKRGNVGYVAELKIADGRLTSTMTEVEYGDEVSAVRLVPLADGRVVLVTGDDASFFAL